MVLVGGVAEGVVDEKEGFIRDRCFAHDSSYIIVGFFKKPEHER